jgi:amino-acid N-acetyltransferase
MIFRKGRVQDVPQIYHQLAKLSDKGILLPRSLSELYDLIRDFYVTCPDDEPETVAGMCALHICWADLGEIRSLALKEELRGRGIGRRLVEECIKEAREFGLKNLFALTYIPEYFMKLGFKHVEKSKLPQKIWSDCFKCVKFPECDEVSLALEL